MDNDLMQKMIAEGDVIPDSKNRLAVEYDEHGLARLAAIITKANLEAVIEAVLTMNEAPCCIRTAVEKITKALEVEA